MLATILQLLGLALIVAAGVIVSPAAAICAAGVVAVYVGLALERD